MAVWLAISLPVQAGANCEAVKLNARQMSAALELAARTSHWLDASGAQVVVLARAGQNLDQWGLKYSHLGFAYHDDDAKAWRVVHKPEIQKALLPLLKDNYQVAILHTRAYSMVAYPWAQKYQQSNQWALETLALAVEPSVTGRSRAQAWHSSRVTSPASSPSAHSPGLAVRRSRLFSAFSLRVDMAAFDPNRWDDAQLAKPDPS
ncbi:MAG: DUF2145 domain-containing protein [Leptothrix sp. (in: b-proteobacteria)]